MFACGKEVPFFASVRVGILDFSTGTNAAAQITPHALEFLAVIKHHLGLALKRIPAARANLPGQGKPVCVVAPQTDLSAAVAEALVGGGAALALVLDQPIAAIQPRFQKQLTDADVIFEIKVSTLTPDERAQAPEQARNIVLQQCDLLISIVQAGANMERTLIRYTSVHDRRVLPVIELPANGYPPVLVLYQPNGFEETRDIAPRLGTWLQSFLFPGDLKRASFRIWKPGFTLGGFYPYVLWVLSGVRPGASSFWIGGYANKMKNSLRVEKTVHDRMWPSNARTFDAIRRGYVRPYVWSDQLGLYYGNRFRTYLCFVLLFSVLAVAAVLLGFVVPQFELAWERLERISLLLVLALVALIWVRRLKEAWLDHRLLAELIRATVYLSAIGSRFHPVVSPKMEGTAQSRAVWQYQSIIRQARLPRIDFDPRYLSNVKLLLEHVIKSQIDWHKQNEDKQRRAHRRLKWSAGMAFMLVLSISLSYAFIPEHFLSAGQWLLFTAALLTAIGSALGAALSHFGFEQIVERSEAARLRFKLLGRRLEVERGTPNLAQVTEWATELSKTIAEEQLSWYNQVSAIAVHLG